jgi:hypothetical protein
VQLLLDDAQDGDERLCSSDRVVTPRASVRISRPGRTAVPATATSGRGRTR